MENSFRKRTLTREEQIKWHAERLKHWQELDFPLHLPILNVRDINMAHHQQELDKLRKEL